MDKVYLLVHEIHKDGKIDYEIIEQYRSLIMAKCVLEKHNEFFSTQRYCIFKKVI